MTPFVAGISLAFTFGAWFYLILTLQLASGFPPIYLRPTPWYTSSGRQNQFLEGISKRMLLFIVCIVLAQFVDRAIIASGSHVTQVVVAGVPILLGLRIRTWVARLKDPPMPLIVDASTKFPVLGRFVERWPMLPFDLWTIGLPLLFWVFVFLAP